MLAVKITVTIVYNRIRPFRVFLFTLGAVLGLVGMSQLSSLESELIIVVVDFLRDLFSVGNNFSDIRVIKYV